MHPNTAARSVHAAAGMHDGHLRQRSFAHDPALGSVNGAGNLPPSTVASMLHKRPRYHGGNHLVDAEHDAGGDHQDKRCQRQHNADEQGVIQRCHASSTHPQRSPHVMAAVPLG